MMNKNIAGRITRLGCSILEKIETGGSPRLFFRCRMGPKTCIVVYDRHHAGEYIKLQRHLLKASVAVPEIYRVHRDLLIVEDLGRRSLLQLAGDDPAAALPYYKKAIKELIKFQIEARPGAPVVARYDARHIEWEQRYFKRFFLHQYLKIPCRAIEELNPAFTRLKCDVSDAIRPVTGFLMHRDYQSSNIMIKRSRVRIIDFQSARIGPLTYDLAALLRDAYVSISTQNEHALVDYYLQAVRPSVDEHEFRRAYRLCVIQRLLQALGAFANLSLNRSKPRFAGYIGRGMKLLAGSLRGSDYEKILGAVQNHGRPD